MPNEFSITVSGIEEVCAALDSMPKRLLKQAYTKALVAAAVPIVERLTVETPKDTGDLVEHIKSAITINDEGKGGDLQVGFGKLGYIARFLEFGHRIVGHKPDKKVYGNVQPKPFMRATTETTADAAIEAFANSIRESIDGGLI